MSHKSTHGHHRFPRCPVTGKGRFREHKDATLALRRAFHIRAGQRSRGEQVTRLECAAYRCEHCRGWHLSTQSLRLLPHGTNFTRPARRLAA
jgi:hypothetical protein